MKLTRREIIAKEYMRRELVNYKLNKLLDKDGLKALHALDKEMGEYDLFIVMLEEITSLETELAELEDRL